MPKANLILKNARVITMDRRKPRAEAVAVAGDFAGYSGGIYNESATGQVNHAVNLVGWDDTVQPGHWIMRNSWSSQWGENGWMRIAYGSRKIGYAATLMDYDGPMDHDDPTPTPTPDPSPTPEPEPDPDSCLNSSGAGYLVACFVGLVIGFFARGRKRS